jgi:hypothetical protein
MAAPHSHIGIGHDQAPLIDQHTYLESFSQPLYSVMGADIDRGDLNRGVRHLLVPCSLFLG